MENIKNIMSKANKLLFNWNPFQNKFCIIQRKSDFKNAPFREPFIYIFVLYSLYTFKYSVIKVTSNT